MTAHLLLITLGPVKDFIAQARRTRDLWYGTRSTLGDRSCCRAISRRRKREAQFPSVARRRRRACWVPCAATPRRNASLANKLLAEVPPGVDPRELARTVHEAVMRCWHEELAAPVKAECAGLLTPAVDDVWAEQVNTFLDFAASWLTLGDYAKTRRQLEQAIAGRKMLRDFDPWAHGRGNVPKSSLDGARETVRIRQNNTTSRRQGTAPERRLPR